MFTSEQLDALQAAAEAAVELADGAEWFSEVDLHLTADFEDADVAFIAAWNPAVALEVVAAHRVLLSRIARVEALHTAHTKNTVRHGSYVICDGCGGEWPCETLRALTEGEPSE